MSRYTIIFAIAACYFVFAILLNSVGTVILQSINSFAVSKPEAASLEGFKDLSIAIVSFMVASFLPRVGYKFALLIGLCLVSIACLVTPLMANFVAIKLLFACIGTAFALVKVSVYSIIGQLSHDTRSHSSLLNTIEGIFMLGVLSGYWFFSAYIDSDNPAGLAWLDIYFSLAIVTIVTAIVVFYAPIEKSLAEDAQPAFIKDFVEMITLAYQPLVLVFVISIFFYVLIEQGLGTWLPTFNSEVLKLPVDISIQITSIFAAMIALGRLMAGQILKRVHWYHFLNVCIASLAVIILVSLPLAAKVTDTGVNSILSAPLAAYLLPIAGLMMAPIYPVINSVMLSALAPNKQASMTGLIVVFSALGGTTGSIITGFVFESMGGTKAFYLLLIPIVLITVTLYLFKNAAMTLQRSAVRMSEV